MLSDRATRRFEPVRVNPMQQRQSARYRFFNCRVPEDGGGAGQSNGWVSLGVHPDRPEGPGLLWLRFRAGSPGFTGISRRRRNLGDLVSSMADGDFWIGFEPPPGFSGEDLVEAVARRITEIATLVGVKVRSLVV